MKIGQGKIKRILDNVVATAAQVEKLIEKFEHKFKKQSLRGKIGTAFTIAAATSVLPGGYIALEIWAGRKIYRWVRNKTCRRPTQDQTAVPHSSKPPAP